MLECYCTTLVYCEQGPWGTRVALCLEKRGLILRYSSHVVSHPFSVFRSVKID